MPSCYALAAETINFCALITSRHSERIEVSLKRYETALDHGRSFTRVIRSVVAPRPHIPHGTDIGCLTHDFGLHRPRGEQRGPFLYQTSTCRRPSRGSSAGFATTTSLPSRERSAGIVGSACSRTALPAWQRWRRSPASDAVRAHKTGAVSQETEDHTESPVHASRTSLYLSPRSQQARAGRHRPLWPDFREHRMMPYTSPIDRRMPHEGIRDSVIPTSIATPARRYCADSRLSPPSASSWSRMRSHALIAAAACAAVRRIVT